MPPQKTNGSKPKHDTKSESAPGWDASALEPSRALALVQPEADALPEDEVLTIRVDIPRAVSTALGAWPAIKALRPSVVNELPRFPIATFDTLETYALAALYAHLSATSELGSGAVKVLLEEAAPLRQALLVSAEPLAHRGLVDAARVAEIRAGQGHLDTANDLVALGALYSSAWGAIGAKTAVAREEVDRATVLGTELLAALGQREQAAGAPGSKTVRARAFTLFVRAYETCQRAVTYLRWNEGDAAKIAPSLFKPWRRAGKNGGVVEEPAPAVEGTLDDTSAAPIASPVEAPAPVVASVPTGDVGGG